MKAPAWMMVLLAGFLSVGCNTMRGSQSMEEYRAELDQVSYGRYWGMVCKDLARDFGDIFRAHVAAGEGIGLDVQATELGQAGVLFVDDMRFGWQDRSLGMWTETRKEGGLFWNYYRSYETDPIYGTETLFERPRAFKDFALRHNTENHWADLGAQGHLIFLGAGGTVSPKETLDFAIGLLNLPVALVRPVFPSVIGIEAPVFDYSEDNTPAQMREKHGLVVVPQAPGLEGAELLNDWWRLPY